MMVLCVSSSVARADLPTKSEVFSEVERWQRQKGSPLDFEAPRDKLVPELVERVKMAAANGDASAQYQLGRLYIQGALVPKNLEEAARWWLRYLRCILCMLSR